MDLYQKLVVRDLSNLARNISPNSTTNLSIDGKTSLHSLQKDSSIVIKNADKGGVVVVMDASAYREEALRQLSDKDTYCELK